MSAPTQILHVVPTADWALAQSSGSVRPPNFEQEGFVHCCTPAQLDGVLERYYAGRDDITVLQLDPSAFGDELVWEAPAHADGSPNTEAEESLRYPHVYAEIRLDQIIGPWPST